MWLNISRTNSFGIDGDLLLRNRIVGISKKTFSTY